MAHRPLRIWIDLENSPHVFFFHPIIQRLRELSHEVVVTARDFCNTLDIAGAIGLSVHRIGAGYEKGRDHRAKSRAWRRRIEKLMAFAGGKGFDLAASHCSRTQAPAAMRLGIPVFATTDYEFSDLRAFSGARAFMVPEAVPAGVLEKVGIRRRAIRHYPGLKENVYIPYYQLDPGIRGGLGIPEGDRLVTLRPASDTAHYGNGGSRELEDAILLRLSGLERVHTVILPRTDQQKRRFASRYAATPSVRVLKRVVDGPSLIAASNLMVSGGGTMVREAAALGIPAASYFDGEWSAVDRMLLREGRLNSISTLTEALQVQPEERGAKTGHPKQESILDLLVEAICESGQPVTPSLPWTSRKPSSTVVEP